MLNVEPVTKICAWRVLLNRLPTRNNLSKRRVVLNSNLCPLCNQHTEATQHLFLSCVMIQKVWDNCDKWIDISSIRQNFVFKHFRSFHLLGCTLVEKRAFTSSI